MTPNDLLFAAGIAVPFDCENCGVVKRDPEGNIVFWNMRECFYGWCRKCGTQDGPRRLFPDDVSPVQHMRGAARDCGARRRL